jgi:putative transposase
LYNQLGKIAVSYFEEIPEHFNNTEIDEFIVMPNHIHGIIIIEQSITGRGELNSPSEENKGHIQYALTDNKFKSPSQTLGAIVRGFKSPVAKRLRELKVDQELIIWQRNYYEQIIRNDLDLHNNRQYIQNNPLKWELDEYYNL